MSTAMIEATNRAGEEVAFDAPSSGSGGWHYLRSIPKLGCRCSPPLLSSFSSVSPRGAAVSVGITARGGLEERERREAASDGTRRPRLAPASRIRVASVTVATAVLRGLGVLLKLPLVREA